MPKRIMKNTETLAVVKVWGTNISETISLNSDLLSPTMVVDGTPRVNITFLTSYSQTDTDNIVILRNSVPVVYLNGVDQLDFAGNFGITEDTENAANFVVTITGTAGVYLNLRKVSGYKSKIETAQFSVYDDTNAVGS
jgi:hypothetical protein